MDEQASFTVDPSPLLSNIYGPAVYKNNMNSQMYSFSEQRGVKWSNDKGLNTSS
jgi:hypothetical protein